MVGVARIYLAIFESPRIYLEIVGVQSGFTLRWLESSGFTLRWLVFVRTHLAMVGVCWLLVVLVCLAHDEDVVSAPEGVGVHLDRVQVGVRVSPLCLQKHHFEMIKLGKSINKIYEGVTNIITS